jgi:hypothetical protein
VVNRVKSVAYSTEPIKIFRSYDNLVRKVMPTIYLCNIIQFYFMTSAKTYQWVLPLVFHAISRDVIIKFHKLFPHMLRKSLTLFHTFPHMLRKFAHFSTHAAEIRTLFHTCCGNSHTVPHASTPGTLSASLPMEYFSA